jgi:hypothetical protein
LHRILPPGGSGVGHQVDGDTIAWNCGLRRDIIFDDGGTQTEITAENVAGERAEAVRGEKKASDVGMAILPAGADIRRVSDPTGAGAGGNFRPRVRPAPAPRIGGCGAGFIFHPWVTRGYPPF